ncbi:Pif-1 protein 2 [Dolichomitus sp. PSUC_FEM 10030005]|nr:Pif-1 protein 2 [Dolichomitus sp. PSUC_FEM 10030005]
MFINFALRFTASKIFIWSCIFALTAYYLYNVIFFMTHMSWQQHTSASDALKYYDVDKNNIALLPEDSSEDNGENGDKKKCDIENRVMCTLTETLSCAKMCNTPTTCVRFTDTNVPIIMRDGRIIKFTPDKNLNIGLCIDINQAIEAKKCTARNGAKRELHEIADGQYGYVCECTAPTVFTKNNISDDCNIFLGCKNRASNIALDNWQKPEEIKCSCHWNEIFFPYDGLARRGPLCERGNYYQVQSTISPPLHDKLYLSWADISPEYTKYFGGDKSARTLHPKGLPNPCRFDALTNKPVEQKLWNEVYSTRINNIVVCVSKTRAYRTISFEGDYLHNNNGIRANGVVKITDMLGYLEDTNPRTWMVYETGTADPRTGNLAPPLVGKVYFIKEIVDELFVHLKTTLCSENVYPFATTNTVRFIIIFNYPEENVIFESTNHWTEFSFQVFRNLFTWEFRGYAWRLAYQNIRTDQMQYNFYEDAITDTPILDIAPVVLLPHSMKFNPYKIKPPMITYEPLLVTDINGKRAINTKCPFYTGQIIITANRKLAPLYHEHSGLISSYIEYANDRYPTIPQETRDPNTWRKAKPLGNRFKINRIFENGTFEFNDEGPFYLNETTSSTYTCIPYESFLPNSITKYIKCSSNGGRKTLTSTSAYLAQILWNDESLTEGSGLLYKPSEWVGGGRIEKDE